MCNPDMKPYPIFLNGLDERHCIVIGGGHEGEGKVKGLLDVDAIVTLISPTLTPALTEWAEAGLFTWLRRDYKPGDLANAFMVIAERADPERNKLIWEEAEALGILVNVMDDVDHCNFVAGSVVKRGRLVMSISTSGASPTLAVRLREQFEQEIDEAYEIYLDWMMALRPLMAQKYSTFSQRKPIYYELTDGDLLNLLRNCQFDEARQLIKTVTGIELPTGAVFEPG